MGPASTGTGEPEATKPPVFREQACSLVRYSFLWRQDVKSTAPAANRSIYKPNRRHVCWTHNQAIRFQLAVQVEAKTEAPRNTLNRNTQADRP